LLTILLMEEFKLTPSFRFTSFPHLIVEDTDAALVIGDYALAVDRDWSNLAYRIDLGQWWCLRFGLPMVFAVWAARGEWQAAHNDECAMVGKQLELSLKTGLGWAFSQVIAEAAARTRLSYDRLERYFLQELDFSFSSDHWLGLNRYKSLCEKHALLGTPLPKAHTSWLSIN